MSSGSASSAVSIPRLESRLHWILQWPLRLFSSLGFTVVLLLFLALLTYLGTLEQVELGLFDAQKKYFESLFLIHDAGFIQVPLPGAGLVQLLLFFNILVGGIIRIRKGWKTCGILVTHVGICFLLFSGFWKLYFSDEGHTTLYEQESANYYQSYHDWEIAVSRDRGNGQYQEFVIPQTDFMHATGPEKVTLFSPDLPFDLEVSHFIENCQPQANDGKVKTVPVVDGLFLQEIKPLTTKENNLAGIYADVVVKDSGRRHSGLLWGYDLHRRNRRQTTNWGVEVGDDTWLFDLRHTRFQLPFTVTLDKFTKEEHARTAMPKVFSSDVTVARESTAESGGRAIKIEMNEPLRDEGLVLYQASWGPPDAGPGEPLFSTLSVVRNGADQWPLYSCIIIGLGLLIHFLMKLWGYIRGEVAKA